MIKLQTVGGQPTENFAKAIEAQCLYEVMLHTKAWIYIRQSQFYLNTMEGTDLLACACIPFHAIQCDPTTARHVA